MDWGVWGGEKQQSLSGKGRNGPPAGEGSGFWLSKLVPEGRRWLLLSGADLAAFFPTPQTARVTLISSCFVLLVSLLRGY